MSTPEPLDEAAPAVVETRGGDRPEDYIDAHTGGEDCPGCSYVQEELPLEDDEEDG